MDGASLCERRNGMRLEHEDRWLSDPPGRQEQAAEGDAPKVRHRVSLKRLLAIERDDNVGLHMITAWMALAASAAGARTYALRCGLVIDAALPRPNLPPRSPPPLTDVN